VAVVRAVRPTGWHDHQSGSCKSGESYREGFIQLKWKLMGCSFEQPFFYGGSLMEQKRLGLYTVNMKYIRNLHNQGDDRVFSVSPQIGKDNRPFVGIVVVCCDKQYCVPLSSPKEKHKKMKNDVDFYKIIDADGKLIGVLDFNNMIPVRPELLREVDVKIHPKDSQSIKNYKNLLIDQISFCRQNQEVIIAKANKLYKMVGKKNASGPLKRRCLNWKNLEEILNRFKN
jgi:protein AbiQ